MHKSSVICCRLFTVLLNDHQLGIVTAMCLWWACADSPSNMFTVVILLLQGSTLTVTADTSSVSVTRNGQSLGGRVACG